jgi:glycosyltransferase involved in cell wall biosynthesis
MRILQVMPYFSPRMGGSARVVYETSKHLHKKGHDVTVVAGDYRYEEVGFPQNGFHLVLLPSLVSRWGFYLTPSLISWARHHASEFDVIHLHEVRTFQNAVMRYFAVRYGVPYVLSAHGTLPIVVQRKAAKRLFDLFFGRRLLVGASRFIAVSPFEVQQYGAFGIEPDCVDIIYNGLDLEEFADLPAEGTLRKKLGIPGDAKIVLFLGRLHRRKGIDYLVRAFAQMAQGGLDALLMITGPDDGELTTLQALVEKLDLQERVIFTGPLYGREKLAAYVDADVVASPAVHEIFGLVSFEALMSGAPVVVCDDGGQGRLIRDADAGYLVPYGNVTALAAALQQALTNREQAMEKVRNGQDYIRERLDWRVIVTELQQVYTLMRLGP